MHISVVSLFLSTWLITGTLGQKEIIRFAFFYPFDSPEISHPPEEYYNITTVLDYGMQLFNASVYGEKYELRYSVFNTNCTAKEGNRAYIEMLQQTNSFPFIIGPACTLAAEPIALDINSTNIIAISYYVASKHFSNQTIYPNFFRLFPTELTLVLARVNFIQEMGWRKVAVILESVSLFTSVIDDLEFVLENKNIDFEIFIIFDKNKISETVEEVIRKKYSIVIGLFYSNVAIPVLCEAYKQKQQQQQQQMVWLLDGWFRDEFWTDTAGTECTPNEIREYLEYSVFFTNDLLTNNESAATLLGPDYTEFHTLFNSSIVEDNLVFDTFSAMVAAIQEYDTLFGGTCDTDSLCLGDFSYQQTEIATRLRNIIHNVSFQGITGKVKFTAEGDRLTNVLISQFRDGVRYPIGNSSGNDTGIFISGIKWPGGTVPNDGSQEQNSFISLAQFLVFSCIAAIGAGLSVVYIVIILIRWKHGAISSNTPLLTLTTLIGSIVLYIGTILLQIPNLEYLTDSVIAFDITCSLINWVLTIGFSLTFYPLFLKMLYAFYIKEYKLKNVGARKRKIKLEQIHLLLILAGFLLLDILYLILWTAIPQIRFVLSKEESDLIVDGLPVKSIEYNCGAPNTVDGKIVIGILIASKAVIMVVSMVIAFDTRSLKFKKHRENIWVGISLYTVAVLGVIGIICHQFILQQAALKFGLVVICMLIAVASTTNLLFLPLLFLLLKDPKCKDEYGIAVPLKSTLSTADFTDFYTQTILRLEQENETLKSDNNKLTTNNNKQTVNNNKLTSDNKMHRGEIKLLKSEIKILKKEGNTIVNRFGTRKDSEIYLIRDESLSLPLSTINSVNN